MYSQVVNINLLSKIKCYVVASHVKNVRETLPCFENYITKRKKKKDEMINNKNTRENEKKKKKKEVESRIFIG